MTQKEIVFQDNGVRLKDKRDDDQNFEEVLKDLSEKPISQLADDNSIIYIRDKDSFTKDNPTLLDYQKRYMNGKYEYRYSAGNFIGVLSIPDNDNPKQSIKISIISRFDAENQKKQPFLCYLLSRVYDINIAFYKDMEVGAAEGLWNILLVIVFVDHLKKAYSQGVYKQYEKKEYNDYSFKGVMDVTRHLKVNTPFLGKIAYNTREYTYDNPVLWLVRHAIERIRSKHNHIWGKLFENNRDTMDAVQSIRELTPSYSPHRRPQFLPQALKPVTHPLYTAYEDLRKTSLQILRDEMIDPYGNTQANAQGVLFDVSLLWERYILRVLEENPENKYTLEHSNFQKEEGVAVFYNKDNNKKAYRFYPDFLLNGKNIDKTVVMDAKYQPKWSDLYKAFQKNENNDKKNRYRKEIQQVLSYILLTNADYGGVVYPCKHSGGYDDCQDGTQKGEIVKREIALSKSLKIEEQQNPVKYWYLLPFYLPNSTNQDFNDCMKKQENKLQKEVNALFTSSCEST